MSTVYMLGTFNQKEITTFVSITAGMESLLRQFFQECGINVFKDLHYFSYDSIAKPLFYKVESEWVSIIGSEYADNIAERVDFEVDYLPIPLDGNLDQEGHLNCLSSELVIEPNYQAFIKRPLTIEKLKSLEVRKVQEDFFYEQIIHVYDVVSHWLLNKEKVFWCYYL